MRTHPLGGVMFKTAVNGTISGMPAGVFMFYFGFSLPEVIVINAVSVQMLTLFTLDPLRHSHLPMGFGPLDYVIISPLMHQAHHSSAEIHWDKNFGTNLSIFDWLFGTAYRPAKDEKFQFGIYGCSDAELQEFNTLWGAYISPVIRMMQALARPVFAQVEPIRDEGSKVRGT
jgi:sterol desaturase/sphingolipid hydroxylase (fatty acid hydroxylase superfamily)